MGNGKKNGWPDILLNHQPHCQAFTLAIMGAEYIMNWLPKSTHQYVKFIEPIEMVRMLKDAGLEPVHPLGMTYNPLGGSWKITDNISVNYLVRSVSE